MKHSGKLFKIFAISLFCAGFLTTSPAFAKKVSAQRQQFISYALGFQGTPYVSGGHAPGGFDCSGFVHYATNYGIGVQIPRTCANMYSGMTHIKDSEREPGDLVFFKTGDRISHVGIYLGTYKGEGRLSGKKVFLSAVSDGPRTGIVMASLDENYWKTHYFAAARFLPSTEEYNSTH